MVIRWFTTALALAPALLWGAPLVHIEGDRLSVNAKRTPLREVLDQFAHAGVLVKLDPEIDVLVTGSCRNTPMEEALDALLLPFSYAVFWDIVRGPLGDLPRLSEIQVFGKGRQRAARPLRADDENFVLTRGPSGGPAFVADELLVTVRAGANLADFRRLLDQIGGTVVESVPSLGVYRIRVPAGANIPDLVAQLARNPLLQRAEPNYAHRLPDPAADDSARRPASSAPAPAPIAGAARVAVLDSGLMPGTDADGAVVGRFDALNPTRALADRAGHGTQMALVAAGAVQPAGGTAADAGVPLLAIRAFDDQGVVTDFTIMRALTYALEQNARVINLSWGSDTDSPFLAEAISYAQSRGAVIVAAAGNIPTGRKYYPAAYPGVVAVAALDRTGQPWSSSNYGDFVDLAAPGTAVLPVGYQGPAGPYAGTSIASAYVAREIALYLTRHPNSTGAQAVKAVTSILSGGKKGYGLGYLDADAAARLRTP